MTQYQHKVWKGTTGGTEIMLRSLVVLMRVLPRVVLYGVMALVVPFYMLINRYGYRSTFSFFRERMKYGPLKSFFYVYANHFRFGQVILDRFAMYAGKKFSFECEGLDLFREHLERESGFMMASSHTGNYELAGYSLTCGNKTLNALVFGGEKKAVMSGRNEMFAKRGVSMIPVEEDMSHIFKINTLLGEGQIVSMPCDRIFGSPKYLEAEFFGSTARFPMGPFSIAVSKAVPLVAVFAMKESVYRYQVYVRELKAEGVTKLEKMASLCRSYANELEDVVRRYPAQWFNYFDFWNNEIQ